MPSIRLKRAASNVYAGRQMPPLPFEQNGIATARSIVHAWDGYTPTALKSLSDLATELNVGSIYFKDESTRFGLGSFKPLGGAYAVSRCLARTIASKTGEEPANLFSNEAKAHAAHMTITAATDGNHGRSVAWGARMYGCRCVIFVCASVSDQRKDAIASYGAEIREVDGSFDDAVRLASATAQKKGWHVIPDTADSLDKDKDASTPPRDVTQGYMLVVDEALEQLKDQPPITHIFLQAGVGGLASASAARFWQAYGTERPVTVIVEPDQCACWFESLVAGKPVAVTGDIDSDMAGLACGEVSMIAWQVLQTGADHMVTITDEVVPILMTYLAQTGSDDRPIVAGETGISGLAGLIACAQDKDMRARMGLGPDSRIFVIGSEGDTDPGNYKKIVGHSAAEILAQ